MLTHLVTSCVTIFRPLATPEALEVDFSVRLRRREDGHDEREGKERDGH